MPKFGKTSRRNLETCHPQIIEVCEELIQSFDFSVIQGHRSHEEQAELLAKGYTTVGPGKSKHNASPSNAVDIYPYIASAPEKSMRLITVHPKQVGQYAEFWSISRTKAEGRLRHYYYFMAGRFLQIADSMGYRMRWGGNWDGDADFFDSNFFDLPHFERT